MDKLPQWEQDLSVHHSKRIFYWSVVCLVLALNSRRNQWQQVHTCRFSHILQGHFKIYFPPKPIVDIMSIIHYKASKANFIKNLFSPDDKGQNRALFDKSMLKLHIDSSLSHSHFKDLVAIFKNGRHS